MKIKSVLLLSTLVTAALLLIAAFTFLAAFSLTAGLTLAAPPAYDPGLEFKVLAHIFVGDNHDPRGIAVVGDNVYVANHDDDSISVISANTLTVTQVISANSQPCAIAYNPDNGYLYVTNRVDSDSGTVTIIDTDIPTYTQVATPVVGRKPTGIAFNPNDGYIYVAMNNTSPGNVVKVISGTTITYTIFHDSFDWPAHIAVKEASNLLYVTNHDGTVSIIDGSTRTVTEPIDLGLQDLWGIAVNQSTGWVYAAAATGGELGRIQPNDTVTDPIKPDPAAALSMVAVDSGNNLVFVTEDEPDASPTGALEHVLVFDAEAGDWVDELEITVQQDPERGIAFDPVRHRLYVSNRISDTVTVIQTIRKVYLPIIMKSSS